jgi:AraC family transcriptional regulator
MQSITPAQRYLAETKVRGGGPVPPSDDPINNPLDDDARQEAVTDELPVIEAELRIDGVLVELGHYDWPPSPQRTQQVCEHSLSMILSTPHRYAQGCYLVAGNEAFADYGDMFLVPAGIPFRSRVSGGPIRFVRCRYDPGWFEKLTGFVSRWDMETLRACLDIRNPALHSNMVRLAEEVLSPGLSSEVLMEALCITTAVELARHLKSGAPTSALHAGGLAPWQLRRITGYIDANPAPGPKITQELTTLCGVSARHLRRQFKQTMGRTLGTYRRETCLEKAKSQLWNTTLPIKTIACQLGFSDAGAFCSLFRRTIGVTPRAFRQQFVKDMPQERLKGNISA